MVNLILGLFTGIIGTILFFKMAVNAWWVWALFLSGSAAIIFGSDVVIGSLKEHETRAATLGFLFFTLPGLVLVSASLAIGLAIW